MWEYDNARKQIEKEGRTREWVSKQCCVKVSSLKLFLTGKRNPSRPVIRLMALCLNCPEEYLTGQQNQQEEQLKSTA